MSGRKEIVVTIPSWGQRDAGKHFKITEWPAATIERWGLRMMIVLKGTTAQIPEEVSQLGAIAVAIRGINSFLAADVDPDKLIDLLDQLLECVQVIRDPQQPHIATAIVSSDDIEEVVTRGWLRSEVLRLHTNFSLADSLLNWWALMKPPADLSTT